VAELSLYVVFDHPSDFPDSFVVREQIVRGGGSEIVMGDAWTAPTLEEVRKLVPPHLHRLDRSPGDDPNIVEVWL
jgi:hypothetical protein